MIGSHTGVIVFAVTVATMSLPLTSLISQENAVKFAKVIALFVEGQLYFIYQLYLLKLNR
jgi:hypothetical protein